MSTQSPYLNAIILFPLITQVIGSSIAYVVFELDYYREGYFDSALFGFFLTFWLFTVPTILLNAVVTFDINGKKSSFSRLLLFFVTRVQVI